MKNIYIVFIILFISTIAMADNYDTLINSAKEKLSKNPTEAGNILNKSIKIDPNRPEAYIFMGIVKYSLKEYEKTGSYFKKGLYYIDNDNTKKQVIKLIYDITARFINQEEFNLFQKSFTLIEKNKSNEAIPYLTKAMTINPGNSRLYYELGYAYIEVKNQKNAIKYLEHGRSINPSHFSTLKELLFVYSDTGNLKNVKEVIKDISTFYGDHPLLRQELAYCYSKNKKINLAIQTLKDNVTKFKNNIGSYYMLGELYYDTKQYKEAKAAFTVVITKSRKEEFEKSKSNISYESMISNSKKLLNKIDKMK